MKINNYNIRRKGLEPLIATILLIVVSVILVTIVLTWGKEFSTSSLNKTNNFGNLKASDAAHFIYPKSAVDGVVQFTYSPPAQISNDINITHYRVVNIPEMTEPIALSEPKILSPSLNILELPCLYEYSTTNPNLYIQLITADNTYIDIKTKDAGMVCTSGGTGTEENPKIICNAEDLNNIRNDLDANYALGKDIDLQCFSRLDENGWVPIGNMYASYNQIFDGKMHKIKNLYINLEEENAYAALFYSLLFGEIKNLKLEDVNIFGNAMVGSLVGYVQTGIISNCYSTGDVYGTDDVGGLIGYSSGGQISSSYFIGTVYGAYNVGGIVGNNEGIVTNNYALGSVYGTECVGGLVGMNGTIVTNNYSVNIVSGTTSVGGLICTNGKSGTVNYSYYDTNVSNQSDDDGRGTPKTTTELKTQSTFTGWDFSTVWAISSSINDEYPYLRSNPPR